MWRLLRNQLPTKDNFVRMGVVYEENSLSPAGCGSHETADHLFLGFETLGSVWPLVWQWLQISSVSSCLICDHFFHFCHLAGMLQSSHSFFKVI